MVTLSILILMGSVGVAIKLQHVVSVTNRLIQSYSALDQWQAAATRDVLVPDDIRQYAEQILMAIPEFLGEQKIESGRYTQFLYTNQVDDGSKTQAKQLNDVLVWELFECHRLQNLYSSIVNLTQIALVFIMMVIGALAYFMGRRAQDFRLAPFPEANPNPVFGLNSRGELIYTNDAVEATLLSYFGAGRSPEDLLPSDFQARLQTLRAEKKKNAVWIHAVKDHIFQLKVQLLAQYDRIHIYSEDITEQEQIRARNAFIAYHDPVCLLANRQRLEQIIDELTDPNKNITLVMTYVTGMAQVLSTQGLNVLDHFARDYSIRLREAYQAIATEAEHPPVVFRFDANMFGCVFYSELNSDQHILLERLLNESVQRPFVQGRREFYFGIQSGAACEPSSISARQLIQRVNVALHSIAGRDKKYQVFDADIEATIQAADFIEQGLRHAIERDELQMFYQPQQDLVTGALIGFEALMRWRHLGDTISPVTFIPVAEKTGLIHSMGNWALRDVLKQAIDWDKMQSLHSGVIAVNVSAVEFARRDFIEDVESALADYPFDPKGIQLEITESLLLEDESVAIERMHKLKSLGFSLAIDDFGTGYSSFSYLSRFPVDKLKIDRSFIVNMKNGHRDVAIVAAMVDVAHQLGIQVIAEGVEELNEREILVSLGCDQLQGYYFGRPMSASEATVFASGQPEVL